MSCGRKGIRQSKNSVPDGTSRLNNASRDYEAQDANTCKHSHHAGSKESLHFLAQQCYSSTSKSGRLLFADWICQFGATQAGENGPASERKSFYGSAGKAVKSFWSDSRSFPEGAGRLGQAGFAGTPVPLAGRTRGGAGRRERTWPLPRDQAPTRARGRTEKPGTARGGAGSSE